MIIINSLENLNIKDKTALALGNFDGIHAGHKVIMKDAIESAKELGLKSVCFTFSNHPFNFIMGRSEKDADGIKLICQEEYKIKMIEKMGFDYLVNVPFDENMMTMSSRDFFNDVIVNSLNASLISVGFNYSYGARAEGKADTLYKSGCDVGITVHVHDAVKVFHTVVSSTLIRETLEQGNMELAAMYLDREYSFKGTVEGGKKIGRANGFPTINIPAPEGILLPPNGVYFSRIIIDGVEYKSISNIGKKPTFGDNNCVIETHVFDYDGNAYDKKVVVILEHFHREEKKFDNKEDLYKQIDLDCKEAKSHRN